MMCIDGAITSFYTDVQAVERWRLVSSTFDCEHNLQDPSTMDVWLGKKLLYDHYRRLCNLDEKCIMTLELDRKLLKIQTILGSFHEKNDIFQVRFSDFCPLYMILPTNPLESRKKQY